MTNEKTSIFVAGQLNVNADNIEQQLNRYGYKVDKETELENIHKSIYEKEYDLVCIGTLGLVDIEVDLLKKITAKPETSIIWACESDCSLDRIVALELGADDVVDSSCGSRELVARIKALVRRSKINKVLEIPKRRSEEVFSLDEKNKIVFKGNKKTTVFTEREYDLLAELVKNSGNVVSREDLSKMILDKDWHPLERNIDNIVARTRKHFSVLEVDGVDVIKTVRHKGYLIPEGIFV